MVDGNAMHDRVHVSLRLRDRDSRFQTRHDFQKVAATIGPVLLVQREGRPQTHFTFKELKARGHHADDCVLLSI